MPHLTRSDLWSLEQYSEQRESFRAEVLAHKKTRQLALGENARLLRRCAYHPLSGPRNASYREGF